MSETVYRNATLFDGLGGAPVESDVLIRNGLIAAIGKTLPVSDDAVEIECRGLWLMPGMLDIHTHLDRS